MKITRTLSDTGFFYTSYAVYLSIQQPERLIMSAKWLYPEIAEHYTTTPERVEKSIYEILNTGWAKNRKLMETLANCPLKSKPTVSRFIAILASVFHHKIVA